MRSVLLPVAANFDVFEEIAHKKSESILLALIACAEDVKARYAEYWDHRFQIEDVVPLEWDGVDHRALLHCYNSGTDGLRALKSQLINSLRTTNAFDLLRCPYCQAREPRTWDHFLPKELYPEFSINPANLIYVCPTCNLKKGDRLFAGPREAMHVYFDPIPDVPILHCAVDIENDLPIIAFGIKDAPGVGPEMMGLARRHFVAFELAMLYVAEAGSITSSFVQEVLLRYPAGIQSEELEEELRYRYLAIPVNKGPNYWEARLWIGIRDCAEFLDFINAQIGNNVQKSPIRGGFDR
jgi:hypothetical protein